MKHHFYRPVIPLLFAFIAGIFTGEQFSGYSRWGWFLVFVNIFFICNCIKYQTDCFIFPFCLFICLGYLSIQPWVFPKLPYNHILHFSDNQKYTITGIVKTPVCPIKNRFQFIIKAQLCGNSPAAGLLCVNSLNKLPKFSIGDQISFSGKIRAVRNFSNPGGFDYERYMLFKGIYCTTYILKNTCFVLAKNKERQFYRKIENFRTKIAMLINNNASDNTQALLMALILGDRSKISSQLREDFSRAGISHLLAISGLHIGIISLISFCMFAWIFSWSQYCLWNACVNQGAALVSLFPIFAYGLISGMSPSTQRAIIMACVFLIGLWFKKEHDLLNTLAVAAMTILIFSPISLFSISFQLSFSAVGFIVFVSSKIQDKDKGTKDKQHFFIKFFVLPIKITFLAILGTLPFTMLYFNQIALTGLIANLIFIPLIGFMTIPLALAAVFIYPLIPVFAEFLIAVSAYILSGSLKIIPFFAGFFPGFIRTITPSIFEICCYYFLLWTLLNFIPAKADQNLTKHVKQALLMLAVILCTGDFSYWIYQRFFHNDLKITIIDVGHGSSALLEFPKGKCMLIDGGGFYDNSVFDVGASIVAPYLWNRKIKTIDTIVLSHADSDHLNGLLYIIENFDVKKILTNGVGKDNTSWHKFQEIIEKKNIHVPNFINIPRTWEIGDVRISLLHPKQNFLIKEQIKQGHNNISLVIKIYFNNISILFPGDIEASAETELVKTMAGKLKSTILIAPHHGCRTSSTKEFIDCVDPEIIVISAGWKNRFNCPHPSIIDQYKQEKCKIFRTDKDGAVLIFADNNEVSILPYRFPDQTFIISGRK